MAVDPSRLPGLLRVTGLFIVAVGGPVGALAAMPDLRAKPWLAALLVLAFELLMVGVGFATAVLRNLHDQWATRTAEAIDAWVQRRTSVFTGKYLRYMVASNRYLDVKGLSTQGEYTLEMRDILVRLSLVATPVHKLSPHPLGRNSQGVASKRDDGTVWQWLRRAQRDGSVLAIVGPPGSGKTTLLRHVAFTLGKGGPPAWRVDAPRRIPVIVNLRHYRSWSDESPPSMVDLIRRSLAPIERTEPLKWVEVNLQRGNFLVMLDGLDEMPEPDARRSLAEWLEHQASSQSGNVFVVTSRPFGYRANTVGGATVVEVQPFNGDQIDAFVRQWYQAICARSYGAHNDSSELAAKTGAADLLSRLDEAPMLSELTANPLLLTMIANVHHYRGALPGTRSELYQEICEVFLGKRHQARGVAIDIPGRQKQAVLRVLAYEMMRQEVSEVPSFQACEWIETALGRVSETLNSEEFLQSVEESSGLLIEKERGTFAFAHLTFQEFLAADYIREDGRVEDLVEGLGSPWWRETILLYAAVADATPIVQACLVRASEPAIIALAMQCVEEAREVTAELRPLLEGVVDPPDARINPASRRAAAQARLLLRASKDMALNRTLFLARSEITCVEYQYFLDSTGGTHVPDHWTGRVFPKGMENEPVVGVRYEDAVAFCRWMQSETSKAPTIRLPRSDEVDSAVPREGFAASPGRYQYWTLDWRPALRDAGFSLLIRRAPEVRKDPYPALSKPSDRGCMAEIRLRDRAHVGDYEGSAVVEPLLGPMVDETESCDVGQLQNQIALVGQLVSQYLASQEHRPTQDRWDLHEFESRLTDGVHLLRDQAYEIFGRTNPDGRRGAEGISGRQRVRGIAMVCAGLAATLYIAQGGDGGLQRPGWIPKPTRRVPRPSALPTVITNAIAHALLGIYVDLALLEARIAGNVEATEAIIYARQLDAGAQLDPVTVSGRGRHTLWRALKPLSDRAAAVLFLFLMAPILLFIASAIKLDSHGPALYRQTRVGLGGREFVTYKFRTMVVNADALLAELAARNETDGLMFKMRSDPRVTRVGRLLRRYTLDELPLLISVLMGHMSFVGPRPPLPSEVARYDGQVMLRLAVRPGLTGLWQVSGRSDLSWEDGIRLDLAYVDDGTFRTDLSIILRTFGAVFVGRGAY